MRIGTKLALERINERVAFFVRAWKADRQCAQNKQLSRDIFALVFHLWEAFSSIGAKIGLWIGGGERVKLQVAHIKLSHSRAFLVRAIGFYRRTKLHC